MPPTDDDKAFRWRLEDSYRTVTGNAFAKLVHENGLEVKGPFEGYFYAMKDTTEGQELYRCFGGSFDGIAEQTAVTSNPAAGTISVDLKTFTGRGRVTAVACNCVADANAATRYLTLYKISGGLLVAIAASAGFTATTTGFMDSKRGYTATQGVNYAALAHVDFAPGDILRLIVTSGQVGDDLSAITYSFKEAL